MHTKSSASYEAAACEVAQAVAEVSSGVGSFAGSGAGVQPSGSSKGTRRDAAQGHQDAGSVGGWLVRVGVPALIVSVYVVALVLTELGVGCSRTWMAFLTLFSVAAFAFIVANEFMAAKR